jgi:hypothetical protein
VRSLLKPLLKKVTLVVGSRMLWTLAEFELDVLGVPWKVLK